MFHFRIKAFKTKHIDHQHIVLLLHYRLHLQRRSSLSRKYRWRWIRSMGSLWASVLRNWQSGWCFYQLSRLSSSCYVQRAASWRGTVCWGCWSQCYRRQWRRLCQPCCWDPLRQTSWWTSIRGLQHQSRMSLMMLPFERISLRKECDSLGNGHWKMFVLGFLQGGLRRISDEATALKEYICLLAWQFIG